MNIYLGKIRPNGWVIDQIIGVVLCESAVIAQAFFLGQGWRNVAIIEVRPEEVSESIYPLIRVKELRGDDFRSEEEIFTVCEP